jgi:hypothetical protein
MQLKVGGAKAANKATVKPKKAATAKEKQTPASPDASGAASGGEQGVAGHADIVPDSATHDEGGAGPVENPVPTYDIPCRQVAQHVQVVAHMALGCVCVGGDSLETQEN